MKMSDSSSFLVEKLALQYDIDPYTANICIQEALSKILEKEVNFYARKHHDIPRHYAFEQIDSIFERSYLNAC